MAIVKNDPIRLPCDIEGTLNFNLAKAKIIGHITEMEFLNAKTKIEPEIEVTNPKDPASKVKVVGILDNFLWNGGKNDPFQFTGKVSVDAQSTIKDLRQSETGGTEIAVKWVIYAYDFRAEKYFERLISKTPIKCVLTQNQTFEVEEVHDDQYGHPVLFPFTWFLTAQSKKDKQVMDSNSSVTKKKVIEVGTVTT